MHEHSNSFLVTQPIGSLMRRYAIPCIISLLVAALYNIVDQIFIANASYLGSYGNAANTVVFPLTVVALAIAVMIGDGCCAFVSISLVSGQTDRARKSIGSAILLSVLLGILLTVCYLLFSQQILTMFGGQVNPETYACAREYFFWITLGVPFYMFGQAMNPIIRSDGSPRFAMAATLAGAAVNLILDPVFIFGFRWGMMGAVRLVSAPHEDRPAGQKLLPAPRGSGQALPASGYLQLSVPNLSGGRHGRHPEHDPEIRRSGPDLLSKPICPDPPGGAGHRHEVLSDRHLSGGWHGRRMHPHHRL